MKKTKLQDVAYKENEKSAQEIIKLLLADHKLLRKLMKKVQSQKATSAQKIKTFSELKKTVNSHVKAEEKGLLDLIKDHPKFEDERLESYEEHRVHEVVMSGITKVKDKERKVVQMQIFCEILEHHLNEEEEDLFPRFKKYTAKSTRKKMGKDYLDIRKKTNTTKKDRGAARFSKKKKK